MTEQYLFDRIVAGDKSAFDSLFLAYYAELCRFAWAFVRDNDESEEVVQRVFVRLWENRRKASCPGQVRSYLCKAVYNECIRVQKSASVREKHYRNYYQFYLKGDQHVQEEHSEQVMNLLNQAIGKLPERCRQIFILHKMEGLRQKEIASIMNISVKTVENQVAHAVIRLREELKPVIHLLPVGLLLLEMNESLIHI